MPQRQVRGEITAHATAFSLDLHLALLEQLPKALEALHGAPLTPSNLESLGNERGVYQLCEQGRSVYVGKSERALASRLGQHRRRCTGRHNINVDDMSFRCLYVDRFVDAASPERMLIEKYRALGLAPWNVDEGFAPKDVGRNRDKGKPGQWFLDRPADYEALITIQQGGHPIPLLRALELLKETVPFDLFRFSSFRSREKSDRLNAQKDYPGRSVILPTGPSTVLAHLRAVVDQLPAGWQATVLPHGVILYKEEFTYAYALAGWRSTTSGVEALPRGHEMSSAP